MSDNNHSILAGGALIDSMRYGGYKSPAHALAEIIDNSFEAESSEIEIMCKDDIEEFMSRQVERLQQVAIVDNGKGMSKDELWDSLRFGAGTRRARKGIGRFGMGLPYSSISQCKRVEVYSWQEPGKILRTSLDLKEVEKHNLREIPEPQTATLPDLIKSKSKILPTDSGTVVIWSIMDKCIWKKSSTLFTKSEMLVGRIYRKFLHDKRLKIRMVSIDNHDETKMDRDIRPNDPLYLMDRTSTPSPWDKNPMFVKDGEKWTESVDIEDEKGNKHAVTMRFAMARNDARKPDKNGRPAGSLQHGQHANGNLGVSVLRGEREIGMDQNLLQTYDPLERWWGAEIDFPPALDEFFGITNNKQDATNFSVITKMYGVETQDKPAMMEPLLEEDKQMAAIVKKLLKRIRTMRTQIGNQERGRRTKSDKRYPDPDTFTDKVRGRESGGHRGKTDGQIDQETPEQRAKKIKKHLEGTVSPNVIDEEVDDMIRNRLRVKFQKSEWNNSQFFDISLEGGVEFIKINIRHNAYKNLLAVVEDFPDDIDYKDAVNHLKAAQIGLLLLLASWARLEDEEPNENMQKMMANIRFHWGEIMEEFLNK